jgi:hypothetical protein
MDTLTVWTSIINYIALALSVWLGWYVLTRSIRQPISWLTSLTLWSISGIFINSLLALTPPPIPENVPEWFRFLLPFWDQDVLNHGTTGWLSGWLVIPAVGFWHHVTMLIRSERWKTWRSVQVVAVYIVILGAIWAIRDTPYMFESEEGPPTLLNSLKPGVYYSTFLVLLALILVMSLLNLRYARQRSKTRLARRQLDTMIWATVAAIFTAPISFIAVRIEYGVPRVVISILLAISVFLIGFGVGKFSALVEGRTLRRDFIFSGVAMAVVALLYSGVIWLSIVLFDVPPASFVFLIIFAFATHSVIDFARHYLDRIFFQKEDRSLLKNIRRLSREMSGQSLDEILEMALDLASTSVRATFSLIVLFRDKKNQLSAAFQWNKGISNVSRNVLISDDFQQFDPGHLPQPFEEVVLLVPIYLKERQIGTLLFGPPVNSTRYLDTGIDRLLDVSDQVADTIQQIQQRNLLVEQAAQTVQVPQIPNSEPKKGLVVGTVEDALRNIHDYASLGDLELAETKLVYSRLPEGDCTHLDRGKVVYTVIEEAVAKLRPEKELADGIPSREWYPYLILQYAYFEGKLNRDIMSSLYISEGTFNRTRRSAIRTVTRVLVELEKHLT